MRKTPFCALPDSSHPNSSFTNFSFTDFPLDLGLGHLFFVQGLNCLFGLVFNLLIICTFSHDSRLRVNDNLFLLVLAIVDNLMILIIAIREPFSLLLQVDLRVVRGICPLLIYFTYMSNFLAAWLLFAYTIHQLRSPAAGLSEQVCNYKYFGIIASMLVAAIVFYFHFLWIMALERSRTGGAQDCHVLTEWIDFFETWSFIDQYLNGIVPYFFIFLFGCFIALRHLHFRWRVLPRTLAARRPGQVVDANNTTPLAACHERSQSTSLTRSARTEAEPSSADQEPALLLPNRVNEARGLHRPRGTTPHASLIRFVLPLFTAATYLPPHILQFYISMLDPRSIPWRIFHYLKFTQQFSHAHKLFFYLLFFPPFRKAFLFWFRHRCYRPSTTAATNAATVSASAGNPAGGHMTDGGIREDEQHMLTSLTTQVADHQLMV